MPTGATPVPHVPPVGGIIVDRPAYSVPQGAYVNARNVRFKDKRVEMVRGIVQYAGSTGPVCDNPITLMDEVVNFGDTPVAVAEGEISLIKRLQFFDGSEETVIGTNLYLYRLSAPGVMTPINAVPYNAPVDSVWEAVMLFGAAYFVNGFQDVQQWRGGNAPMEILGGNPPRGTHIAAYYGHLILGRIYDFGYQPLAVAGSGLVTGANPYPTDWNFEDPNNEADERIIEPTDDPILRIKETTNLLTIYKGESVHTLSYISGAFIYQAQRLPQAVGALSGQSVVEVNGADLYVGSENFYRLDGGGSQAFGNPVWPLFISLLRPEARHRIPPLYDLRRREVTFGIRSTEGDGTPDLAFVYNLDEQAFTMRDWPFSAAALVRLPTNTVADSWDGDPDVWLDDTTQWDGDLPTIQDLKILAGDVNGLLWLVDDENTDTDGWAKLESGLTDLGDHRIAKVCRGIKLDVREIRGANPLQVYIGATWDLADPLVWSGPYDVDPNKDRVQFRKSGKWFAVRFEKQGGFFSMGAWELMFINRG